MPLIPRPNVTGPVAKTVSGSNEASLIFNLITAPCRPPRRLGRQQLGQLTLSEAGVFLGRLYARALGRALVKPQTSPNAEQATSESAKGCAKGITVTAGGPAFSIFFRVTDPPRYPNRRSRHTSHRSAVSRSRIHRRSRHAPFLRITGDGLHVSRRL